LKRPPGKNTGEEAKIFHIVETGTVAAAQKSTCRPVNPAQVGMRLPDCRAARLPSTISLLKFNSRRFFRP